MARRYVRDARGRFASKGYSGQTSGAGARLTATGSRAGGGSKARLSARPAGTISKNKRSAKPQSPGLERGTFVRGNFRPQNLYSGSAVKGKSGYGLDVDQNVGMALRQAANAGAKTKKAGNRRSSSVASEKGGTVGVNTRHPWWKDPVKNAIKGRRTNEFATARPEGVIAHEIGHVRRPTRANSWQIQNLKKGSLTDPSHDLKSMRTAQRVSRYARQNPSEFAAETYAGRSLGKKYDSQVMRLYNEVTGRKPAPLRNQRRRK